VNLMRSLRLLPGYQYRFIHIHSLLWASRERMGLIFYGIIVESMENTGVLLIRVGSIGDAQNMAQKWNAKGEFDLKMASIGSQKATFVQKIVRWKSIGLSVQTSKLIPNFYLLCIYLFHNSVSAYLVGKYVVSFLMVFFSLFSISGDE